MRRMITLMVRVKSKVLPRTRRNRGSNLIIKTEKRIWLHDNKTSWNMWKKLSLKTRNVWWSLRIEISTISLWSKACMIWKNISMISTRTEGPSITLLIKGARIGIWMPWRGLMRLTVLLWILIRSKKDRSRALCYRGCDRPTTCFSSSGCAKLPKNHFWPWAVEWDC